MPKGVHHVCPYLYLRGNGEWLLMNMEFLCGVMKMFWKWIVAMVVQLCEYTENCFPGDSEVKASAWNVGDPVQSLDWEDPLEKEMATHSSTLAWRIPWTEEPGKVA